MINHEGTVYIFFNEMTVDSINYENDRLLLPEETVVLVVTQNLNETLLNEKALYTKYKKKNVTIVLI